MLWCEVEPAVTGSASEVGIVAVLGAERGDHLDFQSRVAQYQGGRLPGGLVPVADAEGGNLRREVRRKPARRASSPPPGIGPHLPFSIGEASLIRSRQHNRSWTVHCPTARSSCDACCRGRLRRAWAPCRPGHGRKSAVGPRATICCTMSGWHVEAPDGAVVTKAGSRTTPATRHGRRSGRGWRPRTA